MSSQVNSSPNLWLNVINLEKYFNRRFKQTNNSDGRQAFNHSLWMLPECIFRKAIASKKVLGVLAAD